MEGFEQHPQFKGLKRLFDVQVPKFSDDLLLADMTELNDVPTENRPDVVLVFAPRLGKHKIHQYGFLKQTLTAKAIATQFILEDSLRSANTRQRYISYLKNLALGIYCKVGGIPWVLSRPAGHNTCYVGLATLFSIDRVCTSIQGFDSVGLWLGGWTEFLDREDYAARIIERIRRLLEFYENRKGKLPDKVIVHKDGELLSEIELKPLSDAFGSTLINVSLKKTPLPRMYDPHVRTDYTVTRGSCAKIDSNTAILSTTGPPLTIHGSQRPITIELKNENVSELAFKDICEATFDLSLLFGGYVLGVVSKPITTYFASQALSMVSQYDITESSALWRKAWFV
jgi:argonaute-like protein implicated in RNA metabolism and viral defense